MKIGMTSLTFREESVENVIKYAKEAGISGIEWGVSDGHMPLMDKERAEKIKKLSAKNGIEIFSLGSYCRMTDREECDKTIETAVMLGAPVIRLWAGTKSPKDCDEDYIKEIISNTVYMAKKAEKYNVRLGFEFHQNTLTEIAETAINLVKKVNKENVGLYWQPLQLYTTEENAAILKKVQPFLIGNLHIHNYTPKTGYQLLTDIENILCMYYDDIKNQPYNLLIEFVKDSSVDSLISDVKALKKVIV